MVSLEFIINKTFVYIFLKGVLFLRRECVDSMLYLNAISCIAETLANIISKMVHCPMLLLFMFGAFAISHASHSSKPYSYTLMENLAKQSETLSHGFKIASRLGNIGTYILTHLIVQFITQSPDIGHRSRNNQLVNIP